MKSSPESAREAEDPISEAAARWTLRHDRGLTAEEQDEFSQWLAADERHRAAWAAHRWGWDELDRLIGLQTSVHAFPDPDLLAPPRRRLPAEIIRYGGLALAAAAAVAVGFILFQPARPPEAPAHATAALAAPIKLQSLEDGSVVTLNRGAEIVVHYTAGVRRVQLVKGEANFQVAKNKERPFIVSAGGVDVRAVGTAFNVRLGGAAVEVLVSEGKVEVVQTNGPSPATLAPPLVPVLEARQRTVVPLRPGAGQPRIATLSLSELETRLAWLPQLLDFTDTPLGDIVTEFNRRNPIRLTVADPALLELRLSASFRSDNVEGFVRLMESDFNIRVEWRPGEIILRRR